MADSKKMNSPLARRADPKKPVCETGLNHNSFRPYERSKMLKPDSSPRLGECKANVAGKTTMNSPKFDAAQQERTYPAKMALPLRYLGGDLGLCDGDKPWIQFQDDAGTRYLTHSVEWLLRNIGLFAEGRDQEQPLACAAHHYGLNTFALLGREHAESEGRTWAAQRAAQRGAAC